LEAQTITVRRHGTLSPLPAGITKPNTPVADVAKLETLIQLIANLQETIAQQSSNIENFRAELAEIKAEQRTIKSQNSELQEEVRSLRTQLDSYSASLPTTRSWASIAAGESATQSGTNLSLATSSDKVNKDPNCLRISTQARHEETDHDSDTFARYLPTDAANKNIRDALQKTKATKEVQVAGVGTTKTGYVIRFKDSQSMETARTNVRWLEELGHGTKLVKPRFGLVVHRTPTEGISLPGDKTECINKIGPSLQNASPSHHSCLSRSRPLLD
jgi:regulator of replication initiation timing